ncbi:MAG TPA: aromatic ring-hydroxylating dioxygenase subunit alpha [Steroidobacteraceae bacterium]|nr:aromatic ring-hydroxylating dioxygenase subunit alpha [Steroidobacteraceae bacterium]
MTPIEHDSLVTNLPREYYFSEAIFEQELDKVLARQWLLVGHVSLVKNPGDYYVRQVGPESLIIARDRNGRVRAYFNVCRHRGSRILANGEAGQTRGFVCPYHKWTYDTEGCLIGAPGIRDGKSLQFAQWPLHEAHCESWYGWLYVHLGAEPPQPLAQVLGPLTDTAAMQQVDSERLRLAHRETYLINANWKALLENNMECYHCGAAHPSLSISCDYHKFYADQRDGSHFPLHPGMATFSMDGARVCSKALGESLPEGFSTGFLLQPNFCGPVFFVDHAVSLELTPLSRDRTQLICEWYVHEEAVEGVDYDLEALIRVFHVTNQEDGALAEQNYLGMKSRRFVPGPLHPQREDGVQMALRRYLEMMAAEGHPRDQSSRSESSA